MKCEKCGSEISKFIGFCTKCLSKENEQKEREEGIIHLLTIGTFSISKSSKDNTINFCDIHFSPKFDYKNKPINTIEICLFLSFIFAISSLLNIVNIFEALIMKGISPTPLSIALPFIFGFLAWLSFSIPSKFNPSISIGVWNINREGFCVTYIDPKSKENKETKISRDNISEIEVRKISNPKNSYLLSPEYGEHIYSEHIHQDFYTLYIRLSNTIYIENEQKREIRLFSYAFSKSANLENIKTEIEKILEI